MTIQDLLMWDKGVYAVFPPKPNNFEHGHLIGYSLSHSGAIRFALDVKYSPHYVQEKDRSRFWRKLYDAGWRIRKIDLYYKETRHDKD